jgi:hypothetical protein
MEKHQLEAIKKVSAYLEEDEWDHLIEHISNVFGEDEAERCEALPLEELYAFCVEKEIEHIWVSVYVVSTIK